MVDGLQSSGDVNYWWGFQWLWVKGLVAGDQWLMLCEVSMEGVRGEVFGI